jgi:outer membrane protein assembly factor BamD
MRSAIIAIAAALALGACSSPQKKGAEDGPTSEAGAIYQKAKRALDNHQFDTAIAEFENLEATYPFGDHAQQAQLDVAYAYFKQGEYDNAVAGTERFLKLYPQSELIDYAWYLKGLVNFSRGRTLLERLVPRKPYKLDQAWLRNSFNDFSILIRQYPDSVYVEDARQRLVFLRNEMARHELSIAEYYYKRSAMVAVINRVNFMLEQFADSPYSADGLALLTRAYLKLGDKQLASDTLKTLELNAPEHPELQSLRSEV